MINNVKGKKNVVGKVFSKNLLNKIVNMHMYRNNHFNGWRNSVVYITHHLPVHQQKGNCIVSTSRLPWLPLQLTWKCTFFFERLISLPLHKNQVMELMNHMIVLCLVFCGNYPFSTLGFIRPWRRTKSEEVGMWVKCYFMSTMLCFA